MKRNSIPVARILFGALAGLAISALMLVPLTASAAVHTVRWGSAVPGTFDETPMTPTTAQQKIGAASWHFSKLSGSTKCNIYINPPAHLGTSFTVNDIQSISYSEYNAGNDPSINYFLVIYTKNTVNAHGWYDQRLTAEPAYKAGGYSSPLNTWTTWTTAGVGGLTFNDSNNSPNFGFGPGPTLADVSAGPINWSTWPTNPTAGTANTTPIVYGPREVLFISFQTGSASYAFNSYLDEITITLKNGETYVVDLETDDHMTPGPAPSCITPATPCVTIPVKVARNAPAAHMRGYSATFSLSANLQLCSTMSASIIESEYLRSISGTQFQLLDNGGGSYTVDCAILGAMCGATADTGTVFYVKVKKLGALDGTGTITMNSVIARDCSNQPIPIAPGAPLSITIDNAAATAISNLAASQVKTGNDSDGTTKINLTFTPSGDPTETVKIYRAGFGSYPEYDDAGGAVPATPAYPPGGPWSLVVSQAANLSSYTDEPTTRDFWYYVAFTVDACGNVSAVSNKTGGTLNYHLGDVAAPLPGNNLVNTADVSVLGAAYGQLDGGPFYLNYLDVGPTTDFSVNARPTTDNRLQFEDLIMFAINYGQVSKPTDGRPVESALGDAVSVDVPALPAPGNTFVASVNLSSAGRIQGVSLNLDYDRTVVEPVAVEAGELMGRQGSEGLVLSSAPGNVDAAVLGTGATISGSGELARVTFRVLGQGDARVALGSADARDSRNEKVSLNVAGGVTGGVKPVVATFLGANYPNPFHGSTSIPLGLKTAGATKLAVFDVAGRLVKTLIDGPMEAGSRVVEWDGRDDGGRSVASGFYVIRLTAPDDVRTRSVKIVR